MVRAKNYEIVCAFVKVMHKKLWPLFFRTQCSCYKSPKTKVNDNNTV